MLKKKNTLTVGISVSLTAAVASVLIGWPETAFIFAVLGVVCVLLYIVGD